MAEKKDVGKFTIGFNASDPQHRIVIDILNQQARRKAQFIVSAVLHYIHCSETPEIPQPAPVDSKVIEEVVLRILRQQTAVSPLQERAEKPPVPSVESKSVHIDGAEDLLGQEGLSAIANTLAAFRSK